jgi:hypothetical protein
VAAELLRLLDQTIVDSQICGRGILCVRFHT